MTMLPSFQGKSTLPVSLKCLKLVSYGFLVYFKNGKQDFIYFFYSFLIYFKQLCGVSKSHEVDYVNPHILSDIESLQIQVNHLDMWMETLRN